MTKIIVTIDVNLKKEDIEKHRDALSIGIDDRIGEYLKEDLAIEVTEIDIQVDPEMFIVVHGNPMMGFDFYGPFYDQADAGEFAEEKFQRSTMEQSPLWFCELGFPDLS